MSDALASPNAPGPGPPARRAGPPVLTVEHLTVQRGGRTVLEDVSFEVPAGTTLAIVGPNGGGKTTLLRALLGRVPSTGRVRWAGAVRIGYVPQKLIDVDIPVSVEEFLAMKCPGGYARCLATVGLPPRILAEPLSVLSGGELQRVLIAWAIVDRPQVLLFDEPLSNVDVGSQEGVLDALARAKAELDSTVLFVTHDLHGLYHYAERVLVLDRTVRFLGTTEELLGDAARAAALFDGTHVASHRGPATDGGGR